MLEIRQPSPDLTAERLKTGVGMNRTGQLNDVLYQPIKCIRRYDSDVDCGLSNRIGIDQLAIVYI
jgi:hypothetical protein